MSGFRGSDRQFSGGLTGGATPDPISNSEVKTFRADGTAGETLWESRSPPGIILSPEPTNQIVGSGLFYCPIVRGPGSWSRPGGPPALSIASRIGWVARAFAIWLGSPVRYPELVQAAL
jgi:hypothetical protein